MTKEHKVDMSAEAVTARFKLACQLGNFARAWIAARSAATRAKLEKLTSSERATRDEDLHKHPADAKC